MKEEEKKLRVGMMYHLFRVTAPISPLGKFDYFIYFFKEKVGSSLAALKTHR